MSSVAPLFPIPTGRTGTLIIHCRDGSIQTEYHKQITSIHVAVHFRSLRGMNTGIYNRTIIHSMDDGGLIPMPADFVSGTYVGTCDMYLGGWLPTRAPQPQFFPQVPMQPAQMQNPLPWSANPGEAERSSATIPAVPPPQQPRPAPVQSQSADQPIVIEDDDEAAQSVVPAPKEPTPEPAPPSHLRERIKHLQRFASPTRTNGDNERAWLYSLRQGTFKKQEEYCRLFWPSNEQAEVDLAYAALHFKDFTEAHIERLAIEGKKKDGLDWEKDGAEFEAKWLQAMYERSEQARIAREMEKDRQKAAKKTAQREARLAAIEEQRRIREAEAKKKADEAKEKREAEKRAAAEEQKKIAEEKKAEKEGEKREAAAEKKRAREEEKARKAEEKKAKRAAGTSGRKRKADAASAGPSKKRKTNAQLPLPEAAYDEETLDEDGLEAAVSAMISHNESADDNDIPAGMEAETGTEPKEDDGLLEAVMAAFDSEDSDTHEEDSDESDEDEDELSDIGAEIRAAIYKAQQEELASKPPTQDDTPSPKQPAPTRPPKARNAEPKGESDDESDHTFQVVAGHVSEEESEAEGTNMLFDEEAEEASEEEDEDEDEDKGVERPGEVLSEGERQRQVIDAEIEELKGKIENSTNVLMKQRYHQRMNKLRQERMQYM